MSLSPDGSPLPHEDLAALLACHFGSARPPDDTDESSVSAPCLCYSGVNVTVDADDSCGVAATEDWTWPYTTCRNAQRVVLPAAVASGLSDLTAAQVTLKMIVVCARPVTVGQPLPVRAISTSRTEGDTLNWPTALLPSTPSTYRMAYRLGAGQAATDGGGCATPAPADGTAAPTARRSETLSPGDDWDKTL